MSVEFSCECGHQLHAPNKNIGERLRCPVCQVAVVIPAESTSNLAYVESPPEPESGDGPTAADVSKIYGGSVAVIGSLLVPLPGKTTLEIGDDCLFEVSSRLISKHNRRSSLDSITGCGASVIGNPILLVLGIFLLPVNGVGLLFLIPWLFVRHRVLYVYADRTTHAIRIKKSQFDFGLAFTERCLVEAIRPGKSRS